MVGIVIAGHGNFGTGISSSMKLIGGELQNLRFVDFVETMSTETLEEELRSAVDELIADNQGVIIFTDLIGGSPFKTAAIVSTSYENVYVLGGSNLPMLLEINAARAFIEDPAMLVDMAINTGKDQIGKFDLASMQKHQEVSDEDGI